MVYKIVCYLKFLIRGKTKYSLPLSKADKDYIQKELEIVALENL